MRQRRGPVARVTSMADGVATVMRRRQLRRDPRVVLYDAAGAPQVLSPDADGYDELVEAGRRLVDLAGDADPPPGVR